MKFFSSLFGKSPTPPPPTESVNLAVENRNQNVSEIDYHFQPSTTHRSRQQKKDKNASEPWKVLIDKHYEEQDKKNQQRHEVLKGMLGQILSIVTAPLQQQRVVSPSPSLPPVQQQQRQPSSSLNPFHEFQKTYKNLIDAKATGRFKKKRKQVAGQLYRDFKRRGSVG